DYRLLAAPLTARPYPYTADAGLVFSSTAIQLDSVVRSIAPGSPVLLENTAASSPAPQVLAVTSTAEAGWYANAPPSRAPQTPPNPTTTIPIGIPHTQLGFGSVPNSSAWGSAKGSAVIRHSWREVGTMLARPASGLSGTTEATLTASGSPGFP